ncbi:hypothetical protein V493_02479 [Pseudogymnoascus sp. VKM F-4281 (FW-2241)]|nr:hypothetical protein V493_02479 [Pseudogymnoascus sp. VKM F-4281 (FW-2241)]
MRTTIVGVELGAVVQGVSLGGSVTAVRGQIKLGEFAGYGLVTVGVGCGVDVGDGGWAAGWGRVDDDGGGDGAE